MGYAYIVLYGEQVEACETCDSARSSHQKNISKSFQNPVDFSEEMRYNISMRRGKQPQAKPQSKQSVKENKKMTVSYSAYNEEKKAFFEKHHNDFECDTSPMDEYGCYRKVYNFEDDAQWYEVMSPEYVSQKVEVKMCKVNVKVKMLRTEFWSTDAASKYYYEPWECC